MTNRERLLAVAEGRECKEVPWLPDLSYYHRIRNEEGNMPEPYRGLDLPDLHKKVNAGLFWHTYQDFVKVSYVRCEVTVNRQGNEQVTRVRTPVGDLREVRMKTEGSAGSYFVTEFFVKELKDLDAYEAFVRDRKLTHRPEAMDKIDPWVGDWGYYDLVQWGSPIRVLWNIAGLENGVVLLYEHEDRCREFFKAVEESEDRMAELTCLTKGKMVILGDNVDQSLFSPPLYRKFLLPYYQKRCAQFHAAGKIVSNHMDGQLRLLLPLVKESGIDIMDGITPDPVNDYTYEEAAAATAGRMRIFGGVPCTMFCDHTPIEAILEYAERFIRAVPGRIIFNVGDQVPPNADIEKVRRLGDFVNEFRW